MLEPVVSLSRRAFVRSGGLLYARANGQRRIYVCGRYVKSWPKACDNNAVDAEALLALVLQFFQRFMGPELEERLRERWPARQVSEPTSVDLMPARELAALEKDRQRLQQEQENLVQNLLRLTSADLIQRLEAKNADIVRELAEVEAKIGVIERAEVPVPMSADEEIESAAALMRNFGAVLDDP